MTAKTIGMTGAAILCVLLGMSAPGYARQDYQDDKHDQAKPKQNSHDQALPQEQEHQPQRQEESRPQPRDQHQQPDRTRQEQKAARGPCPAANSGSWARAPEPGQASTAPSAGTKR